MWNLAKAVLSWPTDIWRTRDLSGSCMSTRSRMCGSTRVFHADRNTLKETQDNQLQEGARGLQMAQRPAYKLRGGKITNSAEAVSTLLDIGAETISQVICKGAEAIFSKWRRGQHTSCAEAMTSNRARGGAYDMVVLCNDGCIRIHSQTKSLSCFECGAFSSMTDVCFC